VGMWSDRAFQVAGPACENAHSPTLCTAVVDSSPSTRWKMSVRDLLALTDWTVSVRYAGLRP